MALLILAGVGLAFIDWSPSGFNVSVISGANGVSEVKDFTFVVTEKFPSLSKYQDAKVVKKIQSTKGTLKVSLPPGKYGAYIIYKGNTQLYGELKVENYRNDVRLDDQGPWYVEVPNSYTDLIFNVDPQPV